MPTDEGQVFLLGQLLGIVLVKTPARRIHQDNPSPGILARRFPFNCVHRVKNWLGLEEHSGAPTKWRIIDVVVLISGVVAEIGHLEVQEAVFLRLTDNRLAHRRLKHVWKKAQHINSHYSNPSINSTST